MPDDELAVTMTATPSEVARDARPASQIGRYRIQREIGAGGMGVVYAAFDPELERSVALKVVLPGVAADAKQRLLREARAMARLAHPNVVTVYEVGSVDGRDYIAMELIDGQNLVDWLATKPPRRAIIDAFVAAGHGLATAHEAAIVHRDFKPHNVLRSRRGRVMVTDFGLAREAATEPPASRDTQPLNGLTLTGAVLGTPAYMAPEQWAGGEVTPATDQFAFCVAMVEALAGARPFRGDTVEELREAVMRGPDRVDLSRVPRRLRAILRRGMQLDPARRWPTMTALLARLARRTRMLGLGLAGLAAAAAVAIAALANRHETRAIAVAPSCDPPVVAPETVWNAQTERVVRGGMPAAADRLAATFARWTAVRGTVCKQASAARTTRLACLDKVLLRIDAVKRVRLLDPKMDIWGVIAQLFEPDVCMLDDPPRMPASYTDADIAGLALRSDFDRDPKLLETMRSAPESDACAHAYAAWFDEGPHHLEDAKALAQLCGDEQAYAAATVNLVAGRLTAFLDPALPLELQEAQRVVDHAAQPFMTRQFLLFRGDVAQTEGKLDEALSYWRRAQGGEPAAFEIQRRLKIVSLLLLRDAPGDLPEVAREVAAMRALWLPSFGDMSRLDIIDETAAWLAGDIARAHASLTAAYASLQPAPTTGPAVRGKVVDAHGAPVAGATVVVGKGLGGDAAGPAIVLYDVIRREGESIQTATTGADGAFAFAHADPAAEVIAQRGDERSPARPIAGTPVLALAPTRSVHGVVRGERGLGVTWVEAVIPGQHATLVAPVLADNSYTLGGLPLGKVSVHAFRQTPPHHDLGGPLVPLGEEVRLPGPRTLDVLVRGLALDGGNVWVTVGTVHADTFGQLEARADNLEYSHDLARPILEAPMPALARRGDLISHLRDVPSGPLTACASGLHLERGDPDFLAKYDAGFKKQPIRCVPVDAAATRVVIEVPPMVRVD